MDLLVFIEEISLSSSNYLQWTEVLMFYVHVVACFCGI